jgi:thioredoxin reductase
MKQHNDIWDVIIVGGGPAGCNAAMVLTRVKRKVLIIDEGKQRNLKSHGMHNYLTRDGVLPTDYLDMAHKEMATYNINIVKDRAVKVTQLADKGFSIKTEKGQYLCRRLLLATGVTDNIPDVPGMQELWGCCVYHCPFCDGWECRDKVIGLYAGKMNGYGMAVSLNHLAKEVILFTDGSRYLRPQQKAHLAALHVRVVSGRVKRLVYENEKMTCIELQNGESVGCEAVFVNSGHKVNSSLLEQLDCRRTKLGAAYTTRHQETDVKGVYVAGDASFDMHFVIVAAAEGAKAAVAIHNDLLKADDNLYR